ncbi:heme/hemin ABC transporter substrate-binding protein [Vibrio sagamiensis]|uniref:Hemin ABC transporter substrate-binding protein n=1 Tax=Vibrio sagamiensis NBRC 104589 TaxID=1219064 RepID=A0A511QET7_9VIBR|nr:ABC transporter substrate-binding protein [Vibrio sagamiensis]PNQ60905.1 hemin ABC transporter substrate-binding protein [Vibrio agarivorans]GEM75799.1 hemin ABC transporter substrate-binding protein [Vibrio sagamiensis NBRC 104589]
MKPILPPALVAALILLICTFTHAVRAESLPPRIISAGSAITELLIALDAKNNLVAVDLTSEQPETAALPKIGYHRQLSTEGLLALNPTLVIGSSEMGPKKVLDQLTSAGVNIRVVNSDLTIVGLLRRIDQIASLLQVEQQAGLIKQKIQEQVDSLYKLHPSNSEKKKVLFLLIHEGRPAKVAGADTTPNTLIELAGGANPAAKQLSNYKQLSSESIINFQPDVILVSGRNNNGSFDVNKVLQTMPLLKATPAGANQDIYAVDGHALIGGIGLKSLAEAARINKLLYP